MSINWEAFGIKEGSSVDIDMVNCVQRRLGVIFPESYVDLVRYSDSACPEISSFEYGGGGTCISEFFEFSDKEKLYTVSWYGKPSVVPNLPRGFIPIARDAGGYLICIDVNKSPASVEIFNPNSHQSTLVAKSFDEFVRMWHE
ncbi:MAG: SMI1/KNR4 family protein [Pseudomonadota bacterium]